MWKNQYHYQEFSISEGALSVFQARGPRGVQQDNYCAFELISPLAHSELKEIFNSLSCSVNQSRLSRQNGSTVNLTAIYNGQVIAGNLGDSFTVLHQQDGKSLSRRADFLNEIHIPDLESDRIIPLEIPFCLYSQGNRVYLNDGRFGSASLGMSRALGDKQFSPIVIDVPFITKASVELENLKHADLLLYSDGITDVEDKNQKDFDVCALFERTKRRRKNKAFLVGQRAMLAGLGDNATVLSCDLKKLRRDKPILIGLFDGHGFEGQEIPQIAIDTIANHPCVKQAYRFERVKTGFIYPV